LRTRTIGNLTAHARSSEPYYEGANGEYNPVLIRIRLRVECWLILVVDRLFAKRMAGVLVLYGECFWIPPQAGCCPTIQKFEMAEHPCGRGLRPRFWEAAGCVLNETILWWAELQSFCVLMVAAKVIPTEVVCRLTPFSAGAFEAAKLVVEGLATGRMGLLNRVIVATRWRFVILICC
jgi:hypothetical protein